MVILQIALGVIAGLAGVALMAPLVKLIRLLLEFLGLPALLYLLAMQAGVAQRGREYSTGAWWVDGLLAFAISLPLQWFVYMWIAPVQHRLRHGNYRMPWFTVGEQVDFETGRKTAGTILGGLCRMCSDDRRIDAALPALLSAKAARQSFTAKAIEDFVTTVRGLPLLLLQCGITLGMVLLGFMSARPTTWAAIATGFWLATTQWAATAAPYNVRARLVAETGLPRDAILKREE